MAFGSVKNVAKGVGKGVLGMSAAGSLAFGVLIGPWEGRVYEPYFDVGGVLTVCDGITGADVQLGKRYTDAECDKLAAKEVNAHEARLNQCLTADLPLKTKAAFISFAFNVGTGAACKSTLVRKANAGDLQGACNQLSRWVFVKGKRFRGLENRRFRGDAQRVSERTLCLAGLNENYETPLLERMLVAYKDWRTSWSS